MEKIKIRFTIEHEIASTDAFFKKYSFRTSSFDDNRNVENILHEKEHIMGILKCEKTEVIKSEWVESSQPNYAAYILTKYKAISIIYICIKIIDENKFLCYTEENRELITISSRGMKVIIEP